MQFKKFNCWTLEEDNLLKKYFYISRDLKFYGSHHSGIEFIKNKLLNHNINRTNSSINRRMNRLNLKYYSMNDKKILLNCVLCNKQFLTYERYIKRNKNKSKYCLMCKKNKFREWDLKNRERKLKYYKYYYRLKKQII